MKYGFIGCGNMGGAIARALCKATTDVMLCDPSEKAALLAGELGCITGTNDLAAEQCQRLFLAVKPQILGSVLAPLAPILAEKKPLLITMAAGVELQKIEKLIGAQLPIIRIMPNTPVSIGKGTILYCRNAAVSDALLADFLEDMRFCGLWDSLPEQLMDAASALSGCGPAYAYMFIEALADGAVACGVPRANALQYAASTLAGAAEMVLRSGSHPGALKDAVCSPGGSTIAGVKALEEGHFRGSVIDCICAAYKRTLELGK